MSILNEIKKQLYKDKPVAKMQYGLVYHCKLQEGELFFEIPFKDIGDATFLIEMPAQQLIRWLIIPNYSNNG